MTGQTGERGSGGLGVPAERVNHARAKRNRVVTAARVIGWAVAIGVCYARGGESGKASQQVN